MINIGTAVVFFAVYHRNGWFNWPIHSVDATETTRRMDNAANPLIKLSSSLNRN